MVEFRTKEDCRNALEKLNKSTLDGREIFLKEVSRANLARDHRFCLGHTNAPVPTIGEEAVQE